MSCTRVKVKYLSPYFRDFTRVEEETVVVEAGSTVRDVLVKLSEKHGEYLLTLLLDDTGKELRGGVLVFLNNKVVQSLDSNVEDGDSVAITIAADGG